MATPHIDDIAPVHRPYIAPIRRVHACARQVAAVTRLLQVRNSD